MTKPGTKRPFKWTPKREAFCAEYIADKVPSFAEAARRAGFSLATAKSTGWELMQLPEIRERIQELMDARAERVEAKADKTLAEIGRLAHADLLDLFDDVGAIRSVRDIPEDLRRAIAAIEVEELFEWEGEGKERKRVQIGYLKKVKFWSKPDALTLEGKHLKLFTDVVQHEGLDKLADALAAARVRAKSR